MTAPAPPRLDRASLDVAITAAGSTDAPALLLLHGTRRTRSMWRHQLDGLAADFRVLALDMPGHGALASLPFRLGDASAVATAVIESLPGRRAVVVGQSLGGYVGMDVAARRPDLVAGLVLACATAEPRSIAVRAPRTVGAYLVNAAGETVRRRRDRNGDPPERADAAAERAVAMTASEPEPPATEGWLFRGGTRALVSALRESFLPRLAAYPGPTLIVNGVHDSLFRAAERTFLANAADGRLEVIAGTGHLVVEEQPAAFNEAVRSFALEAHRRRRPDNGA